MSISETFRRRAVSRWRAFLVGALTPLLAGEVGILAFSMEAALSGAPFRQAGEIPTLFLLLPGTLVLGSFFAFPITAALVATMTYLMRRRKFFDNAVVWMLAGPLFSFPLTLFLWWFIPEGGWLLSLYGAMLGAIGGLGAGFARPQRGLDRD